MFVTCNKPHFKPISCKNCPVHLLSPPHSITLTAQSCLFPLCISQHPCVLPRQVPTAAGKLLQRVLELFGQEGKNTNDYNHSSSRGTTQSIQEPSKAIQEEHIGSAPHEGSVCVSYAQPHRMNKMLVALLIKAGWKACLGCHTWARTDGLFSE